MKVTILLSVLIFLLTLNIYGQVTNLLVNGKSSNFSMNSGDQFSWSYDVPNPGDSTLITIWIDTDQNGVLNPSTDVVWTFFNQIDGDPHGQNGPPDIDGAVNGHVSFQENLGLAPAHYIMVFKNHNNYKTIAGTINKLASPAITISGSVSVPAGFNKQNIMLSLESQGNREGNNFWNALTDNNGNFTIQMNSDTAGNPWRLRTDNNIIFGSSVISPQKYQITLRPDTPAYTNRNFTLTASSAEIKGTIKNENGAPVIGTEASINTNNGGLFRNGQTDTAGVFHIGLLQSELPQTNLNLSSGNQDDTTVVMAFYTVPSVKQGDAVTHNMVIYKANSTISGKVTLNGNPPNFGVQLSAVSKDTAMVNTFTGPNGSFVLHVSSKIYNYNISVNNIPQGYGNVLVTAHPGQQNVLVNLTLTDVKSGNPGIPLEYNLSQNYPNPFNPNTTINYSLARDGFVTLTVYNAIGEKVATLVNENKPAGTYTLHFNGSNLSSGIYLYRLESGNYSAVKKFILMK